MIRPVKMEKFSAVVLEEKKDEVLRDLKERGVIHLLRVEESDISKDFELATGKTVGINVKAGEYLSKIERMLEVFELAKDDEGVSLIKKLTPEPVAPVETREASPSELFKNVDEKFLELEDRVFGISSRLEQLKKEREEILSAKTIISKLKLLNVGPVDLQDFESTFTATGIISTVEIPALRDDISEVTDLFYLHSVDLNKTDSVALLIAWEEFEADIKRTLHLHRFEEFRVPPAFSHLALEEAVNKMGTELSQIEEEEEKLLSEIKELKDAEKQNLLLMQEALQIEKLLDETNTFFGNTTTTFLLRGWVPVDRTDEIVEIIENTSDGHCITLLEDPVKHEEHKEPEEHEEHEVPKEHPPTLLKNSGVAKPLELLTKTFGTPSYGKIDPSLTMAISFPIIFGIMFGDVGHGLTLIALGYLLGFKLKLDEAKQKLGRILLLCGICATFCGFLFGEVFGLGLLAPLWLHPLHDVVTLIVFSFYIAIVQLSLGCFISIADKISHGEPLHAIFSPWGVVGLWLYWGGAYLVMSNGVDGIFEILFGLFSPALFVPSLTILGPPLLLPLFLVVLGAKFVEGLALGWCFYEAYEAATRFLFNTISYVRVGVLAVVHAAFASIMLMGVAVAPFPLNLLVFVGGNIFIICFEALICFIQTLRLHVYEFFSKFYEGAGEEFLPFEVMRKYTFLPSVNVGEKP